MDLKEKPSDNHPVIQNMTKYILERYHPEIGNWGDVAEPEVKDGVHCRWVRYRGNIIIPIDNKDGDGWIRLLGILKYKIGKW